MDKNEYASLTVENNNGIKPGVPTINGDLVQEIIINYKGKKYNFDMDKVMSLFTIKVEKTSEELLEEYQEAYKELSK